MSSDRSPLEDEAMPAESLAARIRADGQMVEVGVAVVRDAVLAIHRPVHRVFSWAKGGTTDYDPCPTCHGKAGVHECGCWSDTDVEYVCAECDTTGRDSRRVPWPCRTAIAVGVPDPKDNPQEVPS